MKNIDELSGKWDYSELPANVKVGEGCFLERRQSFERFRSRRKIGLEIGNNVRIYTWTTFSVDPTGQVVIGDDSTIVGAVVMCADRISIGRGVIISYNVTLADADFHPIDPEQRKLDAIANAPLGDRRQRPPFRTAPITIGDDVWIGIGAIILKGITIEPGVRVMPGAVVTKDVRAGNTVSGNPARIVEV